ncbi:MULTISPECIES: hypothetical protein [unclassified Aeromonas]|uniref:hypothetical protein n=1 Tax=unclassified Aeromonas TaxID=257493 RepID=UPI00084B43B9|nr:MULTISPECIES: hypothetical protein [unclassified Aeromonas]OEC41380.1 hypothetical protein A9G06_13780 [Aeromonas sp. DNP9]OEC48744.1 hypothetical protein A9G04_20905 [Aeromonas sp. ANNP30]OEC60785.1 hypothetical protein A9G49_20970 [Aeromonas sp. ANP5]
MFNPTNIEMKGFGFGFKAKQFEEVEQFEEKQDEVFEEATSTIDPEFEIEIRRFVRCCWAHGLKDDWIDSLTKTKPNPSIAGMTGLPRDVVVELMRNELNAVAEIAERERELEAERIGKLYV